MKLKDFLVIIWPGLLSEGQRIQMAVYLAVMGFASSLLASVAMDLQSWGPAWMDAVGDFILLGISIGFGVTFLALTLVWVPVLSVHLVSWRSYGSVLLLLMSFVMNAILLDAAVHRPQDYQNMAAGILAALIIAVATTHRNSDSPAASSKEE